MRSFAAVPYGLPDAVATTPTLPQELPPFQKLNL